MSVGYEDEEWRPIRSFPNYEISNYGRVWNAKYKRFLKPSFDSDNYGYPQVTLCSNRIKFTKTVHRLVAESFLPNDRDASQVNHIDGNKSNNFVGNLEWVTPGENIRHAYDTGLNPGRVVPVRIVETRKEFESITACAQAINGHPGTIHACLTGRLKQHRGFTFEYV